MNFIARFWHGFIAFTLIASLALPSIATAQDTLDPNDDNIQEFLASLDIELQPTDTLWQEKEFVEFISSYQNIREEIRSMQESFVTLAYEALDMIEAGVQVDDPRVQEAFGLNLTDEELQEGLMELAELRKMIDENAESFLEEDFLFGELGGVENMFELIELAEMFEDFDESYYDEDYVYDEFWLFAWQEPYFVAEAGNIVNLTSEISGDYDEEELEITWTQLNGPDVTWLSTDSEFTAAFIVPEYDLLGDDMYLEFEVHAKSGDKEDWTYVYVDLVMG